MTKQYRKPSLSRTKRKSLIIIQIQEGSFENEDRSTKHPKLENEAPKTRKRSTQDRKRSTQKSKMKHPKLETTVGCTSCMTQSESGGDSGCVRTSKGPQNPSQGFIKACQLFNWTFLDRISSINFIISLAILDTSYLNMHFFGTHACLFSQNGKKLAAERLKYEPFTVNTSTLVSPLFNPCCHSVSIEPANTVPDAWYCYDLLVELNI